MNYYRAGIYGIVGVCFGLLTLLVVVVVVVVVVVLLLRMLAFRDSADR